MRLTIVGVMGPGEGALPQECDRAFGLGQRIATAGWVLLTGGRNAGVMNAANRGAKAAGGLTLGLLLADSYEGMSDAVDIAILTGMGQARNAINVLSSEVVIACGMGLGTASEVALALKVGKPVILISDDDLAYRFFLQCLAKHGDSERRRSPEISPSSSPVLHRVSTVDEAIAHVHQLMHDSIVDLIVKNDEIEKNPGF
ncbi:MAG: hypothetical protein WBA57_19365 [Elainellaceae cyanobacterium]